MRVLVVAAHPDDEVLGAGGTIARHGAAGDEVHVLIVGEGVTSRGTDGAAEELAALAVATQRAAEVLGVADVRCAGLPDNRLDRVDLLDVVRIVEAEVSALAPGIVYTHARSDLNVDHRVVADAVLTATRPLPGAPVHAVYAFEIPSSTEWAFGQHGAFVANHFVVLAPEHVDAKRRALACYAGEMRPFPHRRSVATVDALLRAHGSTVGAEHAEAFAVVRTIS